MDYKPRDMDSPTYSKSRGSKLVKLLVVFTIVGCFLVGFVSTFKLFMPSKATKKTVQPGLNHELVLPKIDEPIIPAEPSRIGSWKEFVVEPGDTLSTLFSKMGLSSKQLHTLINIDHHSKQLSNIHPGQLIKVMVDDFGQVLALEQKINHVKTLFIEKTDNQYVAKMKELPTEHRVNFGAAVIEDSLYMGGKKANIEDKIIMNLAEIFAYDIDFAQDIRPKDMFKVLYEESFVNGEKIGVGPILAAEFTTQGKTYKAIRYEKDSGEYGYYDANGNNLKKAFIRTPVKYTRISSHFDLNRRHPILHKIRAHKGVDYAAPYGTPVKATGDGVVSFIGKKGGYGNTIVLQHGSKYTTLYAHLQSFNKKLKKGSKVTQGQFIGRIGSSGLATGPHLHYEFRIHGVHRNPVTVALPKADAIESELKPQFLAQSKSLLDLMEYHGKVMLAQTDLKS